MEIYIEEHYTEDGFDHYPIMTVTGDNIDTRHVARLGTFSIVEGTQKEVVKKSVDKLYSNF